MRLKLDDGVRPVDRVYTQDADLSSGLDDDDFFGRIFLFVVSIIMYKRIPSFSSKY